MEEIIMRGVLFGALRKSFGAVATIVLCATIFTLMHTPAQLPYAFWGGLLLTYAREKSGTLLVTICIHMVIFKRNRKSHHLFKFLSSVFSVPLWQPNKTATEARRFRFLLPKL